jgi:rod shape-determining protein MreD
VLAEGGVEPAVDASRAVATVVLGAVLLPALLVVDRALVRRRLG